ncbi:MAG: UDP-N-acetylglucosamine--N-acetylmuramyl-(pentapeptide) pyrophosphoryl-undecaprenol N-acetylglucosamine transferase [Candidatus Nealsonbacteria bacterium CG_4_10_14_0_2_um_filter_38_17]|uniref:UDP-N-acetylglucosamine--N-acetylmuramyl-(pentapeptide) pyrophosphoryl-undecaprenol N-acetylglucosamine transferase n=2 Tax=Candidatus Nealsoniibacteriota TaxID=1817911 RepID=A0A2M7UYU6_9BACT|nr:MAG: UDP-N-acetylglucosamine--N-acetylmuramyl-(pentapeptide) pyrophosphoryl-undecaprenol N-acetylglucosamine transferase [Candidatus Nealsonbacteria bacterium CG23_combo_of_CG06-09_8_20_14_all_38_19]PIZ89110.1 MAG: UDP-N-acetylglucosamine--N-acetylmuramyl-(pentapeptide) pyrophosphoryl-undecaprenol N-acetylglucosamine transferase [Candidatus Nealsonbacteria bacterium CG_4_10_14_0_2_um_filter_38_17]
MKILFAGGGTGGHVFPIVAIGREIKKIYTKEDLKLFFMGPKDEFGRLFLDQEGIIVKTIFAGKIRRYLTPQSILLNIIDVLLKTPIGFLQAFLKIFFLAPDLIFSKGGYGSLPVVISGKILSVPVFIHESDITPGLTNKIASKFALEVFTSFHKTEYLPVHKLICVGNPMRRELLNGSREDAKFIFKITGEKPVILILGGSQGAQRINDVLLAILPELLKNFEIIHQCGENNFKNVVSESRVVVSTVLEKYYHLHPFLREEELRNAYKISDLIVSRAGSGSIFEIAAVGKPSILIPLKESAQNHQIKNAYRYAEAGAALAVEEENLTPRFFLEKIKYLFFRPEELEIMGSKALEFSKPRAAKIIAEYIVNYLNQ